MLKNHDRNINNQKKSAQNLVTEDVNNNASDSESIFDDVRYICGSADLITKSLGLNCDVAQLPDGRIIVTETRKVHILYEWSKKKNKMIKISQT